MRLVALLRERLIERLLLVNDPQMLLDGMQACGCCSQHALQELDSIQKVFEDFSRGQVIGHVLS